MKGVRPMLQILHYGPFVSVVVAALFVLAARHAGRRKTAEEAAAAAAAAPDEQQAHAAAARRFETARTLALVSTPLALFMAGGLWLVGSFVTLFPQGTGGEPAAQIGHTPTATVAPALNTPTVLVAYQPTRTPMPTRTPEPSPTETLPPTATPNSPSVGNEGSCKEPPGQICVEFFRYPEKGCVCYPFDGNGNSGALPFNVPHWVQFLDQDGQIIDDSYPAGDFLVVESWSFHNLDQQIEGCVVGYGAGPNRYRLTIWDGRAFRYGGEVSMAERVKASIITQIDAHNCQADRPEALPVIRLKPFGEPVIH